MESFKMKLANVRLSYANVETPVAVQEGGEKKYSVCLLIPKFNTNQVEELKKAIERCKGSKEGKVVFTPSQLLQAKSPLRDGDVERPERREYNKMYFMNVKSKLPPLLLDGNKVEYTPGLNCEQVSNEIYSGVWANVIIDLYKYNRNGNYGVSVSFSVIQKVKDDEKFSGDIGIDLLDK